MPIAQAPVAAAEFPTTYVCEACGPAVQEEGKTYCCSACARDAQRAVPKAVRTPLLAAACLVLGTWLGAWAFH